MSDAPPTTNGHLNNSASPVDIPPSSLNAVDNVKIDMDIQEPESDVRHEPLPSKREKLDHASVDNAGSPSSEDAKMSEGGDRSENSDVQMAEPGPNGHHVEPHPDQLPQQSTKRSREPTPDTPMAADGLQHAASTDSIAPTNSYTTPNDYASQDDDGSVPPPAKRARTFSDPDAASVVHSATPPPTSANSIYTNTTVTNGTNGTSTPIATTPAANSSGPATLSVPQFRFCQSTIRTLKKSKDAGPFLRPVDPVALNIPHYPSIVKHPMDFSTIERKLSSSNPAKPDPNPNNPHYNHADEFIADVRLVFSNCLTFNGPDHAVTMMGRRLEEIFDKQVKNIPAPLEPVTKKPPTPPPPTPTPAPAPVPVKNAKPVRRPSTSVPVIRRSETELSASARPKREIHPPPPKDLPYADAPKKTRKVKGIKNDGTAEQLKFCGKLLQDLNRKAHWSIASPFYEPVDWVKLDIPNYPKIIKKPMDLSTMRKKLDTGEYTTSKQFLDDFKLMISNCLKFNPDGTPVNVAGRGLERLFDEKWKGLPPLHEVSDDEEEEYDDDDTDEERARAIAEMESQMEAMKQNIAALKNVKPEKKPKKEKKKEKPAPSTSKVPKPAKTAPSNGNGGGNKRKGKKPVADDDVLTFEQKKDLSEAIQTLDGQKLEKVIQIIHEGVPEIRDSTEEIELEIDLLPAMVLTKLYNFVLRPLRQPPQKRSRTGKGTGTGGLKRKSMDEDVEAEKIRQLEERIRLFEQGPNAVPPASAPLGHDSEHSSDSSDDSDSGSESE